MDKSISIKAPAKINARLEITGKRGDGYHDLFSIMIPVELFDHIHIKINDSGQISLKSSGFLVPDDPSNLVYRAAKLFFNRAKIEKNGVEIVLNKKIPVAAGLGGGSSDAASTILALNELYSLPISENDLLQLALSLGADVPFFIRAEPSIATGIGEILEPIDNWPQFWYLLITPRVEISTAWVYQNYKMELTSNEYDYIRKSLKNGDIVIKDILKNDLEKVTCRSFPLISALKRRIMDAGAEGAMMSGSGPSVFGVFKSREKAVAAMDLFASDDLRHISVARGFLKKAV
ncbi:MAG: 4-(cytidine 5'-diphospho)-2-C-methyl-D-erythritol kinase [Deltaproteobacteria bacterium]|nr:4-(cytidine 5'-diphospho)-2-C-methyl-D-erythritol kinase [Deltaproteobacteria bacterium]